MMSVFRQNLYDSKHCFSVLLFLCVSVFLTMCLAQSFSSGGEPGLGMYLLSALSSLLTLGLYGLFYLFLLQSFDNDVYWGHTLVFMSAKTMRGIIGSKLLLAVCWEICCGLLLALALNLPAVIFHILPSEAEAFRMSSQSTNLFSGVSNAMIMMFCRVFVKSKEPDSPLFMSFIPFLALLLAKSGIDPGPKLLQMEVIGQGASCLITSLYMLLWAFILYMITSRLLRKQQMEAKERKRAHH